MTKQGKKYKKASEGTDRAMIVPVNQAIETLKSRAFAKFKESVDVDVNLGIDPTQGEQTVRGSVVLPHGRGKKVRIIVFGKGEHAEQAQKAGADHVGTDELIKKIKDGWLEFDYAIATPDMMAVVGGLAKILGPRGLLPNKKVGTVTFDVAYIINELKKGRAFFRNDKGGIVHFTIGRVNFDAAALKENLIAFVKALVAAKPPSSKGKFLKRVSVSSTMGPGFQLNPDELLYTG